MSGGEQFGEALDALEKEGSVWRRQGRAHSPPDRRTLLGEQEIARLAHRVNPLEAIEARLAIEPLLARARRLARIARPILRRSQDLPILHELPGMHAPTRPLTSLFICKIVNCAGNALFPVDVRNDHQRQAEERTGSMCANIISSMTEQSDPTSSIELLSIPSSNVSQLQPKWRCATTSAKLATDLLGVDSFYLNARKIDFQAELSSLIRLRCA